MTRETGTYPISCNVEYNITAIYGDEKRFDAKQKSVVKQVLVECASNNHQKTHANSIVKAWDGVKAKVASLFDYSPSYMPNYALAAA